MLRYLTEKLNKLEKFNQKNKSENKNFVETYRLVGGLNINTLTKFNMKFQDFIYLYVFRYKSYYILRKFKQPDWVFSEIPDIFYDDISYYSVPSKNSSKKIMDYIFKKIGLNSQENAFLTKFAVDIVLDSISVVDIITIFLIKTGIIFMSFLESINYFSYLVFSYIGSIVSIEDNFFATLNSILFTGGSFCYIAKNIKCNINFSTYFRTQSEDFAQFERTLLIVETSAKVNYTEGCSAPIFLESQLHVALVEILVKNKGILTYSTIQNWYHGDESGEGGLYNFTTKRGWCLKNAILDWIQVEMGSIITWKYPSTFLIGDNAISNFFSLSLVSSHQIADTGNKMLHIGSYTKSKVYSKSISLNNSIYTYRGLVKIFKSAKNTYNYTECNSLLLGNNTCSITIPYTIVDSHSTFINQEASISKIESDFIFFLLQRGLDLKTSLTLLLYGFCYNICSKLPLELDLEIPLLILTRTQSNF